MTFLRGISQLKLRIPQQNMNLAITSIWAHS